MKKLFGFLLVSLLAGNLAFAQTEKKKTFLDLLLERRAEAQNYLGRLSANKYDADSISNPYGVYGSRYSPTSVNNPYSLPGAAARSRFATTESPILVGEDGVYLGRLNRNRYDPESVANPYGIYGSRYGPTSISNHYGLYGSKYSPYSVTNPYTTEAPKLFEQKSTPLLNLPTLERFKVKSIWEDEP